jgi:hypothetical protein
MTGRGSYQPSPPPGMSCPSRPAVPAWPFRQPGRQLSFFIRDDLGALPAGDRMTGVGLDRCCEELTAVTALGREHDMPFERSALAERTRHCALTGTGRRTGNSSP